MSSNNGGIRSDVEDRGLNSSEENLGFGATQLGAIRLQPDAPQDLDLVSWPPDTYLPLVGKMKGYAYDSDAGSSTFIYVIDNGINMNNAVCCHARVFRKKHVRLGSDGRYRSSLTCLLVPRNGTFLAGPRPTSNRMITYMDMGPVSLPRLLAKRLGSPKIRVWSS